MTSLSDSDIEKLFSGAPQFFARTESSFPGAPHPSVAFPFDEELEIRDLSDHVQIEDRAWSGVTAWPHLTRDLNRDPAAKQSIQRKTKAHFHIKCRERPNMLSMQGLEKGTMGYQAALELSVGDSLEEEQFGFESVGTKAKVVVEARNRMVSDSGWLKRIPKSEVLDKLKRNGDVYRDNDLRKRPAVDTYKEIFHTFMRPSDLVIDKKNHYSLINQINGLVKCLATSNVWIDFSRVEWRIRLGQILWGDQDGDELDDSTSIHDAASAMERAEEKYWLLLQLLVSTELLLRLDAITEGEDCGWSEYFRPMDGAYFEKQANNSVKWSLLLARSWLENIEVVKHEASPNGQHDAHAPNGGWLASMVSSITLRYHGLESEARSRASRSTYTIRGRNGARQVDGLTHFARKIQWPGIDAYETRISDSAQNSVRPTPATLATPSTATTQRTSYFGAWDLTNNHNNRKYHKTQTHRRKTAAALHASGWLSKSYIFALMLPGEAISHFLMATLLENDLEAMHSIGSLANLCGGFVYRNKTFWSTSCVVGRVLAAGQGAAECMGWISTDVVPEDTAEGWLNIEIEDVHEDTLKMGKKARIWGKKRIERESSILGDTSDDKILPADFIVPHENIYATPPPGFDVELRQFKLLRSVDSVHLSPLSEVTGTPCTESTIPDLPSLPAKLIFLVAIDGRPQEEISFPLTYDISFVTAHPCSPSKRVSFVKSPTSPTIRSIDLSGLGKLGKASRSAHRAGHPLHKYYNYTVIHFTELLEKRHYPLADILKPHVDPKLARKNGDNRVLVVDCITSYADTPLSPILERVDSNSSGYSFDRRRSFESTFYTRGSSPPEKMHLECRRRQFGSDMEILVRALCAFKGWNAIISRRKRGCLACSIREAGALGWKVIIRVD